MNVGGYLMFKTSDLYELISWLILSLVWFGKGITQTTVPVISAQNKGIFTDAEESKETTIEPISAMTKEYRPIRTEVWLYGEAMSLSRNKINKSNERRRKEDRRETASEDNKKVGE